MADAKNAILHCGLATAQTALNNTNFPLDQTTDAVEFIFQAHEAATITHLGYRYGARTGTPPTYKISLQGVDGTGIPDGTIKGGASPASKTFTPPADASIDGLFQYQQLDNAYTCSRGEYLSIVIAYSSGTINGSNTSSFTTTDRNDNSNVNTGFPYAIANDAGVRARSQNHPIFAFKSATTVYGSPVQAIYNPAFTNATTPDEVAHAFTIPSGWAASYQIEGVAQFLQLPAGGSLKVMLYSGTTVLATATHDTDDYQAATGSRLATFYFQDATLPTLTPGVQYRIGFQPQDAAGNYFFFGYTQGANAEWGAYPLGIDWYLSTRTDAGAWTDVTTSRLQGYLILKDVTKPSPGIIVAT